MRNGGPGRDGEGGKLMLCNSRKVGESKCN